MAREVLGNDQRFFQQAYQNTLQNRFPCMPELFSKQEPNVRTLWPGTRRMVFLARLIVHSAVSTPKSLSASPNQLRIEKLEGGLRLFGKLCPQSYKKSSQNAMPKTFFIVHARDTRFFGSQERSGKQVSNLTPSGHERAF